MSSVFGKEDSTSLTTLKRLEIGKLQSVDIRADGLRCFAMTGAVSSVALMIHSGLNALSLTFVAGTCLLTMISVVLLA